MTKKITSIILALIMLFGLSVFAFADEEVTPPAPETEQYEVGDILQPGDVISYLEEDYSVSITYTATDSSIISETGKTSFYDSSSTNSITVKGIGDTAGTNAIDFKAIKPVIIESREFVWDDEYTSLSGWEIVELNDNGTSVSVTLNAIWETREPTGWESFKDDFKLGFLTASYKLLDFLGLSLESALVKTIDILAGMFGYSE